MTNYTVAGKTGTAQKNDGHKYLDKYYASFIGFFPADNPEICIYVALDDPKGSLHQGGQAAAPVFKEIAEKTANYLNIRPDKIIDGHTGRCVAGGRGGTAGENSGSAGAMNLAGKRGRDERPASANGISFFEICRLGLCRRTVGRFCRRRR